MLGDFLLVDQSLDILFTISIEHNSREKSHEFIRVEKLYAWHCVTTRIKAMCHVRGSSSITGREFPVFPPCSRLSKVCVIKRCLSISRRRIENSGIDDSPCDKIRNDETRDEKPRDTSDKLPIGIASILRSPRRFSHRQESITANKV